MARQTKSPLIGYVMIFLSAVGFGSYGIWSKLLGNDFGIFYQGWVRSALVLVILIPLAFLMKDFKPVRKADWKWILVSVLFGVFTQAPLYFAFNNMDIGTATLIFYAIYLITSYVVGRVFIGEKITMVKFISLFLAFIGLTMVFGFSLSRFSLLALILAAINGIASGGEVATTKKSTEKYSSLQIGIYIWAGILITHLPLSLMTGEHQLMPELSTSWLSMVVFAAIGLVSFWLVIEGYKYVDASIGGLIGLVEILSGVVFGILFFSEKLTPMIFWGGLLIMLAAMLPDALVLYERHKKNR